MQGISVYKRAGRPCWYVAYDCPKRAKRVCECTDVRLDDPRGKFAAYAYAREKSASGTARTGERDLSRWDNWVEAWLKMRFAYQKATLTSYLGSWKYLSAYLTFANIPTPRSLVHQNVVDYVLWREKQVKRSGRNAGRNTALKNVKLLSRVMGEAVRRGFCTGNPCSRITDAVPKAPAPLKQPFTNEQIAIVRAALADRMARGAPEDWMPIAFEIAVLQGCRLSATSVPMDRINFETREITFHEKGDKYQVVAIHDELMPLLERLRDEGRKETCILPRWASRYFSEKMEQLNLPQTFHCTRVTVICRLGEASGVSEQLAMAYVGHSSWAVHKGYHFRRIRTAAMKPCHAALDYGVTAPASGSRQSRGVRRATGKSSPVSSSGRRKSGPPAPALQATG